MRKSTLLVAAIPVLIATAAAQQGGTGQNGDPQSNPSNSPANGGLGGHRTVNNIPQSMRERPIPVRGTVVLEQGGVPPEPVKIEMLCGGTIWPAGYSDSKGHFGVQSAPTPEAGQDASVGDPGTLTGPQEAPAAPPGLTPSGGAIARAGRTCDLRATMPGYSSGIVSLAGRNLAPGADIGQVVLHRTNPAEGNTISVTTLTAPKDAQKAFEKGQEALHKRKWDDATKQFDKAVALFPKFASAWYEIGRLRQRREDNAGARDAYGKAIALDPNYVQPYLPMAHLSLAEQKWADAVRFAETAIRLDPVDFPEAFYFNAVGHLYLRHFAEAEQFARRGVKADDARRWPKLYQVLGTAQIQRRDFPGALDSLSTYAQLDPQAPDIEMVRKQIAQLQRVTTSGEAAPARP